MKKVSTAIAILLLGAVWSAPVAAQLDISVEDAGDPSVLGRTLLFDSGGVGERITKRLWLRFDPGGAGELTLRNIAIKGSNEFDYEINGVDRLPAVITNELRLDLFVSYLPTGAGPARGVLELTVRVGDSDLSPSLAVYTVNLVGRVPAFSLGYQLPGGGLTSLPTAGAVRFGHKATGVTTAATLIMSNSGSAAGTVWGVQISGTSAFSLIAPPSFPVRLNPGDSLSLQVGFTPSTTSTYRGTILFDYGLPSSEYSLSGVGGDLLDFRLTTYAQGSNIGASRDVQSGTTIRFGPGVANVDVEARNIRQNAQLVQSIRVTGPFELSGAPRLPASLAPQTAFKISVTPTAGGGERVGELVIDDAVFMLVMDLPDLPGVKFSSSGQTLQAGEEVPLGLTLTAAYPVDIAGTLSLGVDLGGAQSDPSLRWRSGGTQVPFRIAAGQTAAMFAGDKSMAYFRAAASPGTVNVTARFAADPWGINITPPNAPAAEFTVRVADLPEVTFTRSGGTVRAGQQIELGVSIAAPYPEEVAGTLQFGFQAADAGSGAQMPAGGQQVRFRIAAGATGAEFGDGSAMTQFRTPGAAGEFTVAARFATDLGGADITPEPAPTLEFTVAVDDLPAIRFSHDGGTVGSGEQVELSLRLASAYPTDIVGVLALSFETLAFANDPAIQWATGSRQAVFTIPAGKTEPVFAGDSGTNSFQTGTVAGVIAVTPRFFSYPDGIDTLRRGEAPSPGTGVDITPDAASALLFNVMEEAPVLARVALGTTGQGRFTLQVTGYSTGRQVDSLSFTFSGKAGSDLRTPSLQAEVAQAFRTYYGSNQSAAFGSQFTATANFTLDEGVFEDLTNVSVTASNGRGESNSVSVGLN